MCYHGPDLGFAAGDTEGFSVCEIHSVADLVFVYFKKRTRLSHV